MTVRRFGKCVKCGAVTKAKKTFLENVDLLEPERKGPLRGELLEEIRTWKKKPLYCDSHRSEA